jgi:hypothetical protein
MMNCDHCGTLVDSTNYKIVWCHDCWHSEIGQSLLVKAGFPSEALCFTPKCRAYNGWMSEPLVNQIAAIPKKDQLCPQCGEYHQ